MMIPDLIASNMATLRSGLEVVKELTQDQYGSGACVDLPTAGPHYRHIIDHYECFLAGVADDRIDYDSRNRDPTIERDPERAAAVIESVIDRLSTLSLDSARLVRVKMDCGRPESEWTSSTVARELQFLVSHTIHHFSLVRIALVAWRVAVDSTFGVAPSTLRFRANDSCVR